ncbi:MAG: creatininase family protein [Chloroflexota bacterium]
MRFGELTFREIRERADSGWLAVVPTGCTEQQGPHLPVDFDTWFVETVCLAAAKQAAEKYSVNALVLPAIPFGPTPEHRNYGSGYIHIPQELHEGLVAAVLNSLAEQGFKRIIVWRGCGQHTLSAVVESFNKAHTGEARAFLPDLPYAEIMQQVAPGVSGGHADSFATSIVLYLRAQSVRVNQIPEPENKPVDWNDPNLDFARYSSSGVIGDPTHASINLGARLWSTIVETVALMFREIAKTKTAA